MDKEQIQQRLRTRHNLRVGPHTAAYLAAKLGAKAPKAIKILAADARTGVPTPQQINPAMLSPDEGQMGLFQA